MERFGFGGPSAANRRATRNPLGQNNLLSARQNRRHYRPPRLVQQGRSLSARDPERGQLSPKPHRQLPSTPTGSVNRLNVDFEHQLRLSGSWDHLNRGEQERRINLDVMRPSYYATPAHSPTNGSLCNINNINTTVKRFMFQAGMGAEQSRPGLGHSQLAAFSSSFDSSTTAHHQQQQQQHAHSRPSFAARRADSTASEDAQAEVRREPSLKAPSRPCAGSAGSLLTGHANNGTAKSKRLSMDKRQNSNSKSTNSTAPTTSTSTMSKPTGKSGPQGKVVPKKTTGISGSSKAIINFCIENAKGDVAARVVTRMANKREDFNQFMNTLTPEQWTAFVGSLRDYFQAVVQNLQNAEKIKEISVQYGADQVTKRAWGFKADYFAVMANSLTTECVFLDGAQHQPTEAIEAWAELAELMFSNIRDGYYQRIRFLRKNSHCFNTMFTQSSDQSTEEPAAGSSPHRLSPNPKSAAAEPQRRLRAQQSLVGDVVRS